MLADQRLPRYQRVYDDLASRIANGEWKPGEAIATELELVDTYGVAVGTVRKAIDALVSEGVLERFQGRGTFIKRASFDTSLFRFFRLENALGERRVPESRILRQEILEAPSAVSAALKLKPGRKVIRISRLRLFDNKPLLAEEIWLPLHKFKRLMTLDLNQAGNLLYPAYEAYCGQIVAWAEETLTAEPVSAMHARLLRIKAGEPVMVIERLACGYDHGPLEWRRSRGPASHFRYRIEIR
ncbi:MAG TPA: GntR family transcriptional regulator [Gammaproteobacteria bacterium]|jgi:GntR family transcriptional regulator|nr:GntR family transcriptional regulator [Gammaproteobacteria bacterium]